MKIIYCISLLIGSLCILYICTAKGKPSVARVGDAAPSFALPDETGAIRTLEEFKGKKIVLYFYPKDSTPGCTKQACSFRDSAPLYAKNNIIVLGINYDSPQSHAQFKAKHHLPFTLLSDSATTVAHMYGAYGKIPLVNRYAPKRITFLINEQGIIINKLEGIDVSTYAQTILPLFDQNKRWTSHQ